MIEEISNWAGGIVIAVIVVTILEMILPEGKNKKYIKTVLSIYLLFTVISPIIKAMSNEEINLGNILNMESYASTNSATIETNASIMNVYEENLKKDMKNKLEQKGYILSEIKLTLETNDEQNYGKIYEISVKLKKQQEEAKTDINKIENVQIIIGEAREEKEEAISNDDKKEIQDYLSTTYDVEKDKITIF